MGLARRKTARKTPLPPKKQALSSTDNEPLPKRHCLLSQLVLGHTVEDDLSESEIDTEPVIVAQKSEADDDVFMAPGASSLEEKDTSEDTSEDSDAIIEALDDRLVQLQGVVDLNVSALGRLHGRVTMGETWLEAVEHEVVAAGQRDERAGERLDSFAALTIVNTMLLTFVLLRGWFT
ncbi:hypothetical protein L1987_57854 [Smallanthus sonchifolius]|uniref:Uncharacterized protein n=1 Tax=Smallanthus sonchifolius TaxID=185202 RepID=A0ACB9DE58_9ASTR|nr:hypothetical protein L1987_57854 [Smallanthus sonchifolius]